MLRHSTFTLTDDTIVNPTTNGNLLRHVYRNAPSLTFEIANRYDIEATDNNIRLEVNFQGHALVASTNFTFTKDGELGTNGTKYVKMGTVYPANDATAEGIVYEDVDVTTGDMPGSVVLKGVVYTDRLPVALQEAAQTALEEKGFTFKTAPTITRE